uniref:Intermembrane lipid transfer protein VPS13-like C-terminal domain-containing protein n=2 Tax=Clytia hemisphaerica TaxID=252671 RepID=A0A7M5UBR4_9CNID
MKISKPMKGALRRSLDPAVWVEYKQSKSNSSIYTKLHRIQVDDQQFDISFPSVLYPHPLPEKIIKRNGIKPFFELCAVITHLHDVMIFKYFKLLMQEMNLKVDRPIITGLMSLMFTAQTTAHDYHKYYEEDIKMLKESVEESIEKILVTQSTKILMCYFHLSPIKIHLSFSLEGNSTANEDYLFEWFISTIGIHFTDISDAVIKLAFYERKNVFLSQDILVTDVSKHYALQAIKQFYVLVLGLDALGNPYGLITEFGKGFKDLFYEPYLGSVGGPREFGAGLASGIKSLLGHTIGGTAGAAALITEQLGQVVAALSFDSEYKRKRRREMREDPSGLAAGLATGGKQFVMGLVFGVSGLVTKPYQGAKKRGLEGFFKGIGRGLIGLFIKPTGGVIDLVTSSLDGVRRFAEQGGEDITVRLRLPRLTHPHEPVTIYCSEKAFGYSILRALITAKNQIAGDFKDHQVIPTHPNIVFIFTTKCIVQASQSKFFSEWNVEWKTSYDSLQRTDACGNVVTFTQKGSDDGGAIEEAIEHSVNTGDPDNAQSLHEKAWNCLNEYNLLSPSPSDNRIVIDPDDVDLTTYVVV